MTTKEMFTAELDRLAASGTASSDELRINCDAGRFEVEVIAADKLGCAFLNFALLTDRLDGASLEQLTQLSEALAARLSYLLEPISPIETDPEGCTVQMRSNPPQKDESGTSYYELLVRRGGQLSLCRYNQLPGKTRTLVQSHVTREVFPRLAADFEAAVG